MDARSVGLRERLSLLVQDALGDAAPAAELPFDQRLRDLGITSIKLVSLMLGVEAAFGIAIPRAEMTPENFDSIASIQAMLERLGGPGTAV